MVLHFLSSLAKSSNNTESNERSQIFPLLRRWKAVDMHVTEAANEAKDNMKYLRSLEKFIKPLNTGTPQALIDMMPNLMNR